MDAAGGGPLRPLHWLPSGVTALLLSLERTDSLTVQLKALSVTQAVKSLLSLQKKKPHRDAWGTPSPSAGFNRTGSLDALRELAKPLAGAGLYGMSLSGLHLNSSVCQCQCYSEELCECRNGYGGCGCGFVDPDRAACEPCVSEEEFECEEQFYVPESQYQWGFPLAGSVVLNGGPNPYASKCGSSDVRRDCRLPRFAKKNWSNLQSNLGWLKPLERRAASERECAQSVSGSASKVDDGQDSKEVPEASMRSANVAPIRKDDAVQGQGQGQSPSNNRARGEDLPSSKVSIQKEVEGSPKRISEAESGTQKRHDEIPSHATLNPKPSEDNVASSSAQSAPLTRLSLNWWPFGAQSAAAAATTTGQPCSKVAIRETAKWNFRMGQNAGAGALAGGVVSLCLHPIDTLKTIVQSQTGGSRNLLPILSSVISERGLKGLYRGLGSNLASSAPTSAIYTLTYEAVKAGLLRHIPEDMSAFAHCGAGACASVATSIVYTPSECVKQQMQVNGLYQNSWQAFTSLLKQGGLPILYKGWGAVLCRNVPQSVIKFYTYEALKHWVRGDHPRDTPLSTIQALAIGGAAGSTAAFFTTPFDVVKTRLQTQIPGSVQQYNGVIHAFQYIATTEGVAGLYRGLVPRLVIYVTQGALFFASYEFIKHVLAIEVPRLRIKASQIEGYQRQSAPIPAEST